MTNIFMIFLQSETILSNACFSLLFLTTTCFWIGANTFAKKILYGSNISLALFLALRWIHSGHFPTSNLYESLFFLSWCSTFIQIVLQQRVPNRIVGSVLSPVPLLIVAFASFQLPDELQSIQPLVPALKSNWLFMHVSVMILSYASLLLGCLCAIVFLVFELLIKKGATNEVSEISLETQISGQISTREIDNISYRLISSGFPFLTLGILSGAVWANEAWGSYWSWDVKETWALITWLLFAFYLHTRLNYGWQGKKSAIVASFGFIVVWICYIGVNLLAKGLHSYGWFA